MSLLPTLTYNQQDALLLNNLIIQTSEAANHLAHTMTRSNAEFWSLPADRLLVVLNADLVRTQDIFSQNAKLATAVNSALDASGLFSHTNRAPETMGRTDILWDGSAFVATAVEDGVALNPATNP